MRGHDRNRHRCRLDERPAGVRNRRRKGENIRCRQHRDDISLNAHETKLPAANQIGGVRGHAPVVRVDPQAQAHESLQGRWSFRGERTSSDDEQHIGLPPAQESRRADERECAFGVCDAAKHRDDRAMQRDVEGPSGVSRRNLPIEMSEIDEIVDDAGPG